VEFPVALLILLVVLFFPLLDLGSLFMGANSVFTAARVAAVEAARAPTFQNNVTSGTGQSATTTLSAVNRAQNVASGLSTGGVKISSSDVHVSILQVPFGGGASTTITPPVTIDTTQNIYQIQVTVTGKVSPLATLSPSLLGNIPGVTGPLVVTASSAAQVENPQGLND